MDVERVARSPGRGRSHDGDFGDDDRTENGKEQTTPTTGRARRPATGDPDGSDDG